MDRHSGGKREAIVAAAGQLFAAKGYEATTMDEIAALAGVSKATLYRYVPGKESLRDLLAPDLPGADLQERNARARIMEATMDLIAHQGLSRTSLDEIAVAAGVSKGAIYWHFKSKDDLLAAIVAEYSPFPRIAVLIREADAMPLEELARNIFDVYFDFMDGRVDFLRTIISELSSNPDLAAVFQRTISGPMFAAISAYLPHLVEREKLRTVHPLLLIQAFFGPLVVHLLMRDLLEQQLGLRFDRHTVAQSFLDIFFKGIRSGDE